MSDEGQCEVRRFKQEHYDLLVKCAEKGDMTEWNEWYRKYREQKEILGDDVGAYLDEVNLSNTRMSNVDLSGAYLNKANLYEAFLDNADLLGAHLNEAIFSSACLKSANFQEANLVSADFRYADLQCAIMTLAHLNGAGFQEAHLERAYHRWADLTGADLARAHLDGADLSGAHIGSTSFDVACLDEKTCFIGCTYDSQTSFIGTSITSTRIEPDTLTALQKNIRRKYWMKWYDENRRLQYPIRLFWWLSDYGTTCIRCIGAFVLLVITAFITYVWITSSATTDIPQLLADTILATFGFGSLYDQLTGPSRLLLVAQVISGYFLLAVLITRFAVMFQSLTP